MSIWAQADSTLAISASEYNVLRTLFNCTQVSGQPSISLKSLALEAGLHPKTLGLALLSLHQDRLIKPFYETRLSRLRDHWWCLGRHYPSMRVEEIGNCINLDSLVIDVEIRKKSLVFDLIKSFFRECAHSLLNPKKHQSLVSALANSLANSLDAFSCCAISVSEFGIFNHPSLDQGTVFVTSMLAGNHVSRRLAEAKVCLTALGLKRCGPMPLKIEPQPNLTHAPH